MDTKKSATAPGSAAIADKLEHKLDVILRASDYAGTAADGVLWAAGASPANGKDMQGQRKALVSLAGRARDRSGCAKHAAADAKGLLADLANAWDAETEPSRGTMAICDDSVIGIRHASCGVEKGLAALEEAANIVSRVSGCGKENPTREDALACVYACRVDLQDARSLMGVAKDVFHGMNLDETAVTSTALGTKECPFRLSCEAIDEKMRRMDEYISERVDAVSVMARMLCEAKGEPVNHENVNRYYNMALADVRGIPYESMHVR